MSSIAFAIIALAGLWIVGLVVVHRGRLGRLGAAQESTLILAALLILYLGNGRTLGSGDTMPARYLPLALLAEGSFYLDRFELLHARCLPYYLAHVGGHYVSVYPVAAALLALPLYVPAVLVGIAADGPVPIALEKLAAATIAALSAILLYRGIREIASRRIALLATAAYALGSSNLSVSSQALWQHGPSQLALVAAVYGLLRGRRRPFWVALAGLPVSFVVMARPADAPIALCLVAYVLIHHPRRLPAFALAAVPPIAFHLWYNAAHLGDALRLQWAPLDSGIWTTPFWQGLAGLTLSPGRGLFVYSPVFALSIAGFVLAWRRGGDPLLRALSVASCLMLVLYAKWEMWWGGFTFGPRLLADLNPALALALVPLDGVLGQRRALAVAAAALLAWSIAAHAVGAYAHDYLWNAYADIDRTPARLWSWTDNQLVNPFRRAAARASLTLAGVPTSRSAPEALSARYVTVLAPPRSVPAQAPLELALTAVNDGRAVWLAWPKDASDVMQLGWRWRPVDGAPPVSGGALILYHDVAPGGSRDFHLRLHAPPTPGAYRLELGLVRQGAGCVAPIASPELRLEVTVGPPGAAHGAPAAAAAPRERCGVGSLAIDLPTPCPARRR